jgi:hypothetical protein
MKNCAPEVPFGVRKLDLRLVPRQLAAANPGTDFSNSTVELELGEAGFAKPRR